MKKSVLVLAFLVGIFSLNSDARDSKNGFDVANASIPVQEILSGGSPKDGIPAIDAPRFVGAHEAEFLSDDDRVIGIALHGRAKAYPIAIMNWHEIVNDQIGSQPIVVSYCPLCGTGMIFAAPATPTLRCCLNAPAHVVIMIAIPTRDTARRGSFFSRYQVATSAIIPSTIAYWFAWISFYPASDVYRAP
jgi:hypothetical protein